MPNGQDWMKYFQDERVKGVRAEAVAAAAGAPDVLPDTEFAKGSQTDLQNDLESRRAAIASGRPRAVAMYARDSGVATQSETVDLTGKLRPAMRDVMTGAGDLYDAHSHTTGYAPQAVVVQGDPVESLRAVIRQADEAGVAIINLMAIPTRIIEERGGVSFRDSQSYYAPQAIRLEHEPLTECHVAAMAGFKQEYDLGVDQDLMIALNKLEPHEKARFRLMLTGFDPGNDHSVFALRDRITQAADFGIDVPGIGEITLHKELVSKQVPFDADAAVLPGSPFMSLLHETGRMGGVAVIHCDVDDFSQQIAPWPGGESPDRGTHRLAHLGDMQTLCDSVAALPKAEQPTIVWAHAGGIGKFVAPASGHAAALGRMLDTYPFLNVDLSWDVVAKQLAREGANEAMAGVIEKHPDRFMLGSDALVPLSARPWTAAYSAYMGLGPGAPEPALFNYVANAKTVQQVCSENAIRIFGDAVENVRRYTQTLPKVFAEQQRIVDAEGGAPNKARPDYLRVLAAVAGGAATAGTPGRTPIRGQKPSPTP